MSNQDNLINQITGLDFDQIRTNLKTFLKSQSRFADYDFEGSNMSALIDLLAYNTFYMGFYLNSLASEMFLSTATRRSSAVARAKDLGYTPRSTRSASAFVDLLLTYNGAGTPSSISVPAHLKFPVEIQGTRYTFQTTKVWTATRVGTTNTYLAEDVELVEGKYLTHTYTVPSSGDSSFTIPNAGVDSSRLAVLVDGISYSLNTNIVGLESTSLVFFVSEVDGERHKIYFGDDVIGRKPAAGESIEVQYYISSGSAANGASTFTLGDTIVDVSSVAITTVSSASGGAEIESLNSIKLSAPADIAAQNRAVTAADYIIAVKDLFSDTDSVIAWGGEDNVPVALGYVFISIKPIGRLYLSDTEKQNLETTLRDRYCPITISPIVVDPDFLYVKPTIILKYDPEITSDGGAAIKTSVKNTVIAFTDTLDNFGEYFRYSKFVEAVDGTSVSINNSLTEIKLERRFDTSVSVLTDYLLQFFNKYDKLSVLSEEFSITYGGTTHTDAYIRDDGAGKVQVYKIDNTEQLLASHVLRMTAVSSVYYDWTPGNVVYQGVDYNSATASGTIVHFEEQGGLFYLILKDVTGTFAEGDGTIKQADSIYFVDQGDTGTFGASGRFTSIGDCDYANGTIQLYSFKPDLTQSSTTEEIRMGVEPTQYDIIPVRNVILTIDQDDINISAQADTLNA